MVSHLSGIGDHVHRSGNQSPGGLAKGYAGPEEEAIFFDVKGKLLGRVAIL